MLMQWPPRLAALLLVGTVAALSACGSDDAGAPAAGSGRDDTTATLATDAPTTPGVLAVREDLVDPQVVPWRTWRAADDRTLEVTVTAGPTDCYGAEPEVDESDAAVRIRVRVGRLPEAAAKECPAVALESAVAVRLAAPLGTRQVEHLT